MSAQEILEELPKLSVEDLKLISRTVQNLEGQEGVLPPTGNLPRVAGLHEGSIWTSPDFDDELPDEFWGFDKEL